MNTNVITLSGLRGGVGTTSLTAMLAQSLYELGESVLVIDMCSQDLLRLHFGVSFTDKGWSAIFEDKARWPTQIHLINKRLALLPFGRSSRVGFEPTLSNCAELWRYFEQGDAVSINAGTPVDWVLFDMPVLNTSPDHFYFDSDFHFLIAEVDIAAHILLKQFPIQNPTLVVLNKLNLTQPLSSSLLLGWHMGYRKWIHPIQFSYDTHI